MSCLHPIIAIADDNVPRFVSAIHIPDFSASTLISGGGDPSLKVWDWMTGVCLGDIPILETVLPYIRVRPQKKSELDEDGERKPNKRRRKKELKNKAQASDDEGEGDKPADDAPDPAASVLPEEPFTLAVHKIASLTSNDNKYLVFSAIGFVVPVDYALLDCKLTFDI